MTYLENFRFLYIKKLLDVKMIRDIPFLEITAEKQSNHYMFLTVQRRKIILLKIIENSGPFKEQLC